MNSHTLFGISLLSGLALLLTPLLPFSPSDTGAATGPPPAQLQRLVEPIRAAVEGDDAIAIREFCLVFADVLESDSAGLIEDVGDLHARLEIASVLMFQETGIESRRPGLADQIDRSIAEWLGVLTADGIENVELDAAKRAKAIEAFRAIAWAAGG